MKKTAIPTDFPRIKADSIVFRSTLRKWDAARIGEPCAFIVTREVNGYMVFAEVAAPKASAEESAFDIQVLAWLFDRDQAYEFAVKQKAGHLMAREQEQERKAPELQS